MIGSLAMDDVHVLMILRIPQKNQMHTQNDTNREKGRGS